MLGSAACSKVGSHFGKAKERCTHPLKALLGPIGTVRGPNLEAIWSPRGPERGLGRPRTTFPSFCRNHCGVASRALHLRCSITRRSVAVEQDFGVSACQRRQTSRACARTVCLSAGTMPSWDWPWTLANRAPLRVGMRAQPRKRHALEPHRMMTDLVRRLNFVRLGASLFFRLCRWPQKVFGVRLALYALGLDTLLAACKTILIVRVSSYHRLFVFVLFAFGGGWAILYTSCCGCRVSIYHAYPKCPSPF